ncbi:MAG: hypothetical protein BWY06_02334 [Candidatus Latescibacteria bacterium ADurb.Bin168]|nr:MAG: hypothetical protein BWY06_02334 [Candidatus Latescibacteria bacterium ADurb.Bin168]
MKASPHRQRRLFTSTLRRLRVYLDPRPNQGQRLLWSVASMAAPETAAAINRGKNHSRGPYPATFAATAATKRRKNTNATIWSRSQ